MLYITPDWIRGMREQVEAAQSSIHVSALSMHPPKAGSITPYTKYLLALAAARTRGVRAAVWLSAPRADIPAASLNFAAKQWLRAQNIECHLVAGGKLLHAKSLVIDRASIWIGSGNLTPTAAHQSHEAYLNTQCARDAGRWADYLESLT